MKSQSLDLFSLEKKTNDVLKQIFVNGRPHRVVFQGRNPSISSFVSPFSIRGCLFALPFSNGCNCRRPGIPGSSGECRCRHISVSACYNYLKVKKKEDAGEGWEFTDYRLGWRMQRAGGVQFRLRIFRRRPVKRRVAFN